MLSAGLQNDACLKTSNLGCSASDCTLKVTVPTSPCSQTPSAQLLLELAFFKESLEAFLQPPITTMFATSEDILAARFQKGLIAGGPGGQMPCRVRGDLLNGQLMNVRSHHDVVRHRLLTDCQCPRARRAVWHTVTAVDASAGCRCGCAVRVGGPQGSGGGRAHGAGGGGGRAPDRDPQGDAPPDAVLPVKQLPPGSSNWQIGHHRCPSLNWQSVMYVDWRRSMLQSSVYGCSCNEAAMTGLRCSARKG